MLQTAVSHHIGADNQTQVLIFLLMETVLHFQVPLQCYLFAMTMYEFIVCKVSLSLDKEICSNFLRM